jgi:PKD repeat protein
MNFRKYALFFLLLLLVTGGCNKNEPIPSADFTFAGTNQFYVPCIVQFSNNSVNAFSWEWRFGDDSLAYVREPSHLYRKPGKYEVYLRAYTESTKEWASVIKVVTIKDTVH